MKILLYLLFGFVLLVIYVRFLERISVFYPTRKIMGTPGELGMKYEDIFFATEDGVRLNGWLIKAVSSPERAATVLFCHGNAGNIGDRLEKIADFHDLGLNVFIFDYRGYGQSQGRPTENGLYRDVKAAYDYLLTRGDLRKDRLVIYGASLGGAAGIDVAYHNKVAALIVDSTFSSAADMAKRIVPFVPSFLLTVKLDNLAKIKSVSVPKLFIHSSDDETVPYRLGRKLFDAADEPKEFLITTGSHNEGYVLGKEVFMSGIKNFLQKNGLMQ